MVETYASPPRFLFGRRVASPSPYFVRHDALVVAAGVLRACDVLLMPASALLAYFIRFRSLGIDLSHLVVVPFGMIIIANTMSFARAYDLRALDNVREQLRKVTAGWTLAFALLIAVAFFDQVSDQFPRLWIGLWFALGSSFSFAARIVVLLYLERRRRAGTLSVAIAVVGSPKFAREAMRRLTAASNSDVRVMGLYEPRLGEATTSGAPTVDALLQLARKTRLDEIIVELPPQRDCRFKLMLEKLGELPVDVNLYPDLSDLAIAPRKFAVLREAVMINVFERPLSGWAAILKRLEDVVLSAILLVMVLPLVGMIAMLVKLDSPGPVFFRQQRFGFNNNPFLVYKFRTMCVAAATDPTVRQARRSDPRVTRVGRILRRTSLDELPQLLNVLRGDMSLVGPRPHAIAHNEYYARCIDRYLHRHRVKPGITGWAQVNGLRGETPTIASMHARVRYDLSYIENWSIWFDLWILLRTFALGFFHRNAY